MTARADLPTPHANRLRPPSWRDARLVFGLALVLLATVLGSRIIAAADEREPLYVAVGVLAPGQPLAADLVARVDVAMASGAQSYLSASEPFPSDVFLAREIGPGELVPRSALVKGSDLGRSPVTIEVDSQSAATLVVGSVVDVFVSDRDPDSTSVRFVNPRRAFERVSVSWVPAEDPRFAGRATASTVSLLVPADEVSALIEVTGAGARLTLVPVPGSLLKSGA